MSDKLHAIHADEVSRAAEVLKQSFAKDKLMQWLFGSAERYDQSAQALFETWVNYCRLYGVAMRTENFESVLMVRKPGDVKFTVWKMFRSGMFKTARILGNNGMKKLGQFGGICDQVKKETMGGQLFWYGWMLGTDPDKRGQGHGRALMSELASLAKQSDLPCYLETETGSPAEKIYLNLGYKPLKQVAMPSGDGSLTVMSKRF